jgi:hypothetical protein
MHKAEAQIVPYDSQHVPSLKRHSLLICHGISAGREATRPGSHKTGIWDRPNRTRCVCLFLAGGFSAKSPHIQRSGVMSKISQSLPCEEVIRPA